MFTVETDHEITKIVSLDETGELEDAEVVIDDTHVYLRQFDDDANAYEMVIMTYKQFTQIIAAMQCPEGTYTIEEEYAKTNLN